MKVLLSEIKESTRVRKSLSLEKLDELKLSLQEQGQLVPVKLRPNKSGYHIVYGHRRIQAAREIGWTEIEAIVEEVGENDTVIQSLIENVVREDMPAIDIAKALAEIKERTGWTNEKIGQQFGWSGDTVEKHLQMLDYEIRTGSDLGVRHVVEAKAGTGGNKKLVEAVLKKAADDGLSTRQTRVVAEKVKEASEFDGEKGVKAVLRRPYEEIGKQYLKEHDAPIVDTSRGKPVVEWLKDERVIDAEYSIRYISALVAAIALSDQDRGGARHVLNTLRDKLDILLNQVDDVLKELS